MAMNWFKAFWKGLTTPPLVSGFVDAQGNFTPRAQQTLALARREADRFHHDFVGTEHLLLGLIQLGQGTAVNVLRKLGLDLETVRREVEKQVGAGPKGAGTGHMPFTPRVKKVLALAVKEARALEHKFVGTEHILLGLLREGDGVAARVLLNLGVELEKTRQEVLKELDPNYQPATPETESFNVPPTMKVPRTEPDDIDTTKRYDVYCAERDQIAVYRNARFKARKNLLRTGGDEPFLKHDLFSQFLELEQADGTTVFICRSSVIKFCEPGVTPGAERAGGDKS